jgi:transcriptional regulator with XRE-family HTH domain
LEQDWDAVAKALSARVEELGMNLTELATRSAVSLSTVRSLAQNLEARRRQPRTLEALSKALGWPSDYLGRVLRHQNPQPYSDEANDPVLLALTEIRDELRSISKRVSAIEATYRNGPSEGAG